MDVVVFHAIDIVARTDGRKGWKCEENWCLNFSINLFALRFVGLHKLRCKLLVCLWFSNCTVFHLPSFVPHLRLFPSFFQPSMHLSPGTDTRSQMHSKDVYAECNKFALISFTQSVQFDDKSCTFSKSDSRDWANKTLWLFGLVHSTYTEMYYIDLFIWRFHTEEIW